jgi:SAM-dependent methyltransferase
VALDFAPGMIAKARERLGPEAEKVTFLKRSMDDLQDYQGRFDVVVAINSIVMPDVREIDRTLSAIRASLRPGGQFFGVLPAIDALYYQTQLLMDRALGFGYAPKDAERLAAEEAEHSLYDFAFGRFSFQGLRQKFWQAVEIEYRMIRAGFSEVRLDKLLYPWDNNLPGGADFTAYPRSWDWAFSALP